MILVTNLFANFNKHKTKVNSLAPIEVATLTAGRQACSAKSGNADRK
jgi:hypothetical protein